MADGIKPLLQKSECISAFLWQPAACSLMEGGYGMGLIGMSGRADRVSRHQDLLQCLQLGWPRAGQTA